MYVFLLFITSLQNVAFDEYVMNLLQLKGIVLMPDFGWGTAMQFYNVLDDKGVVW